MARIAGFWLAIRYALSLGGFYLDRVIFVKNLYLGRLRFLGQTRPNIYHNWAIFMKINIKFGP